jgi:hypothetical protein
VSESEQQELEVSNLMDEAQQSLYELLLERIVDDEAVDDRIAGLTRAAWRSADDLNSLINGRPGPTLDLVAACRAGTGGCESGSVTEVTQRTKGRQKRSVAEPRQLDHPGRGRASWRSGAHFAVAA